ncbi:MULTISPECIES: hypothetical protein [unclassified Janthinobacterium]|uniref:hypothetical protein n=1 Tax=unclassified Janthinobacterium TaxID=2610881 RepID=UPI00034C9FBD|nr:MULTISPECIES: hypothetical protein [unclassified Janthinobacterium]MEC5162528.1 hypothetical protein [Janthinobacterium sp. CG_S6]
MWAKSLAAGLLGFPLAVGLVGLVALLGPGSWEARTLPMLLLFFPIWVGCIAAAFLFQSGLRAWAWMGAATALCFALMHLVKTSGLVSLPV